MREGERPEAVEWVHERLVAIALQRSALDAEELSLLDDAKKLKLWRYHGYATLEEYMEMVLGYQPRTIQERLRVSKCLDELPALSDALRIGELNFSVVKELTRVASPDKVDRWIEKARGLCVREVEELVSGHKYGSDPEDPKDPSFRRRTVSYRDVMPDTYALERQVRSVANDEAGRNLEDDELLQVVFRAFLAGGSSREKAPYQIAITTCRQCKRSWQNGAGRAVEVDDATVAQARCDSDCLGALDAAAPARKTTSVTPRMREQIYARDGGKCCVPGCRASRNLQIHHIKYQCDGGGHEMSNITLLCTGHHRLHHLGKLRIEGAAPDKLVIERCLSRPEFEDDDG